MKTSRSILTRICIAARIPFILLVVLPMGLIAAIEFLPRGTFAWLPIMQFSRYFLMPAKLFGQGHFDVGIGVWAKDMTGYLQTALFYTLVAFVMGLVVLAIRIAIHKKR